MTATHGNWRPTFEHAGDLYDQLSAPIVEGLCDCPDLCECDPVCPRCSGEGEVMVNDSWPVDPQEETSFPCPRCGGEGVLA